MKIREIKIHAALVTVCIFSRGIVSAATISWTNISGGNWSVAANWDPNQSPGPGDTAEIASDGTYTVTLDVSATIISLILGGAGGNQTLTKSSTSLTLNNVSLVHSNGVLDQSGGGLNGMLIVDGRMNWIGGDISSSLTIGSNGVLNAAWSGLTTFLGALTNSGLVRVTGGGQFNVAGGPIENLPGGVFDFEVGALWAGVPAATFRNAGTLRKSGGSGTMARIGYDYPFNPYPILFENAGTAEAQSGTLRFESGGRIGGSYYAASGAVIEFGGGNFAADNPVISGLGTARFVGKTLTLPADVVPGLSLVGGTLYLGPAFQGGSITNLDVTGVTLASSNTVSGTLTLTGGGIHGPMTIASNGVVNWNGGPGETMGGSGPTMVRGIFNWNGGDIFGPMSVSGSGTLNMGWNSLATLTGALTNAGLVRVTTSGQFNVAGGPIENLPGGVIDFKVGAIWAGVPSATFRNAGTLRKSGGSGATIMGWNYVGTPYPISLENTGMVEAQSGVISFTGGYTETISGIIAISLGGTLPSGYGHINFTGPLPAVGKFTVKTHNGFRPSPGDSFQVLSYPSSPNDYTCLNGLDLGAGLLLVPQLTPTNLTLTASSYPTNSSQPQLFATQAPVGLIVTWPFGFPNWILQSTTNLSAPVWEPVPVQCNNQAVVPISGPQQFFRLKAN